MKYTKQAQELLEQIKTTDISLVALNNKGNILASSNPDNIVDIYGVTVDNEHYYGAYGDIFGGQIDSRDHNDEYILEMIIRLLAWVDENGGKLIRRDDYKNPNPKEIYSKNFTFFWGFDENGDYLKDRLQLQLDRKIKEENEANEEICKVFETFIGKSIKTSKGVVMFDSVETFEYEKEFTLYEQVPFQLFERRIKLKGYALKGSMEDGTVKTYKKDTIDMLLAKLNKK